MGFLTLLAAIGAAIFAERAAHHTKVGSDASRNNLAAFTAIEDASLIIAFVKPILVTGSENVLSFMLSISNVGRSSALMTGLLINGDEQIAPLQAIKPNDTFFLPNRVRVPWTAGITKFTGCVEYSTALHTAARRHFQGVGKLYPESHNPLVLVDSLWTEVRSEEAKKQR